MADLCNNKIKKWKSLDYVAGWFIKGLEFIENQSATFAFVCTSSNCEGLQVSVLWKFILSGKAQIVFAHRPFKWANLAADNAGVTVNIVGVSDAAIGREKKIFDGEQLRVVSNISPYILPTPDIFVETEPRPLALLPPMTMGSMPRDGGHLLLFPEDARKLFTFYPEIQGLIRPYVGTDELVKGSQRKCFWIGDSDIEIAMSVPEIKDRLQKVSEMRSASPLDSTKEFADRPHRFVYLAGQAECHIIGVGGASSENREYLPIALFDHRSVLSNLAFALYDALQP